MKMFHRKSEDRGYFNHGWLKTHHSFSFGDYFDPEHMGFRSLRVINEDHVAPGEGFPFHGHQNMEILTYILEGALEHRDSLGSGSIIRPRDVQYMSAGSGVMHSEFNPSKTDSTHLLQIWIIPEMRGGKPLYAETHFTSEARENRLCLVASPDGAEGSLKMRQDARVFASLLRKNHALIHSIDSHRACWIQLARGHLEVNGLLLKEGDGLGVEGAGKLEIKSTEPSEFVLFDLP